MTDYLENTKCAPARLGAVLVLGLGVSGKAVARYCAALVGSRVDELFIAAGARNDDSVAFVESLAGEHVNFAFGDEALEDIEEHFDVCVASPGIPFHHKLYQDALACSTELISEVEFSWRESAADSTWVAITGTNGKTTTTSCAAHVLQQAGLPANAVGNIGEVCLEAVAAGKTKIYVCEISSYQLYSTRQFAPDVAVMLNITPDHLHWHQSLEAYRDAKFKVFDNLTGVAILDATNDVVRAKVREFRQMQPDERGFAYIPMGTKAGLSGDMRAACGADNAAFVDGSRELRVAFDGVEHDLGNADDLQIKGLHNASNALVAAAVAVVLGVSDATIAQALATFPPLEHRIEPCGSVAGVACFNDSKATNVDATVKALGAFPGQDVIVLLGGDDKDTDLTDLINETHAHAVAAVLFGAGRPRFAAAFEDAAMRAPQGFAILEADHMEDAFDVALEAASPGSVVLLSPACASFDEFKSFEQRGQVFKQLVAERSRSRGA